MKWRSRRWRTCLGEGKPFDKLRVSGTDVAVPMTAERRFPWDVAEWLWARLGISSGRGHP